MRWLFTCLVISAAMGLELYSAPWSVPHLVGLKTEALFDLWSVEHAMGGMLVGWGLRRSDRYSLFSDWLWLVLSAAYGWELAECWMEVHGTTHMQTWLAGTEHWSNRLVTDPLLFTLCAFYSRWTPGNPWVSVVTYPTWYMINLLQPTCMSLQLMFMKHFSLGLP